MVILFVRVQELCYLDGSGRASSKPIVCYAPDCDTPADALEGSREGAQGRAESAPLLQGRVFTNLDALARLCDLEFEVV